MGAFGVNGKPPNWDSDGHFEYAPPKTVTTAIAEIGLDRELIAKYFGKSIQLFLLPIKNVKFGAMIPKETYVTISLLGKDFDKHTVENFLKHPVVKNVVPDTMSLDLNCRCLPRMNVRAASTGFANRMVLCGDSGSTRLFKDGLGAAYLMGKAAAITAVFQGVGEEHFRKYYYPVYKSIIVDNWFGWYLFAVTDIYKKYGTLTKAMLAVIEKEQARTNSSKPFSNILWNMFTGNERYKNVLLTALSVPMHLDIWSEAAKILLRRKT